MLLHADYIGCIGGGDNAITDPNHKNHEPDHSLFANQKLNIRAAGPAYALSRRAVLTVLVHNFHHLRHVANEGGCSWGVPTQSRGSGL